MAYTLIQANSLQAPLPDKHFHCVVTSPPYWGLRRYAGGFNLPWPEVTYHPMTGLPYPIEVEAWNGELGLETTIEAYIGHLLLVFDEVWRVLRDDGTLWLNIGDTYAGSGQGWCKDNAKSYSRRWLDQWGKAAPPGYISSSKKGSLKKKDAIGIPWRLALALQARGWWLRSEVIWHKRNPMPESVKDRPARAHEHLFLLTKKAKYFYDHVAVRQPAKYGRRKWPNARAMYDSGVKAERVKGQVKGESPNPTHNFLSVLSLVAEPYKGAHFATYPQKLVEPCILAGTSAKGCCPICGAPWKRVVQASVGHAKAQEDMIGKTHNSTLAEEHEKGKGEAWGCRKARVNAEYDTTGWKPTCDCAEEYNPDRMEELDPSSRTRRLNLNLKQSRNKPGVDHDLALNASYETTGWEPTCDCAGKPERGLVMCRKCKGTGKETKHRACDRSNNIGREFSKNTSASGGMMNYVPEETGKLCGVCNGVGVIEGDIWPDGVAAWPVVPCRVLDPFVGSGTTLLVAQKLGRQGVGLDLSHAYLKEQAQKRLSKPCQIRLI